MSRAKVDGLTLRTSAALTSSYVSGQEIDTKGYRRIDLFVTYTRGGAGGSMAFKIEVSITGAATAWYTQTVTFTKGFSAGTTYQDDVQGWEHLYTATGAGAELFTYSMTNLSAVKLRVSCKEVGNTGAPGTCAISARITDTDQNDTGQ